MNTGSIGSPRLGDGPAHTGLPGLGSEIELERESGVDVKSFFLCAFVAVAVIVHSVDPLKLRQRQDDPYCVANIPRTVEVWHPSIA